MVEFNQETRKFCRNPKCRMKLPKPVSNPREAFCARGCHSSFYRPRCLICEGQMERKTDRQLICGKRKCRNALQSLSLRLGQYGSRDVISPSKKPVNKGPKRVLKPGRPRPWRPFRGGIVGPAHVIQAEVITRRHWGEVVSPDGVRCYVTSVTPTRGDGVNGVTTARENTDPTNIVVVTFLTEQQLTHYQSTKAGSVPAVQSI